MKGPRASSGLHMIGLTLSLILMACANLLTFSHCVPSDVPQHDVYSYSPRHSCVGTSFPIPLRYLQLPGTENTLQAQLRWNQQVHWQSWNSHTAFSAEALQGMLSRETLNFTRIEPEPIQLVVEDYNPRNSAFENLIWETETSFMSFTINGTDPVRVDGFWIYLRGESKGIFRYRVYGAQPGTSAATIPNTSAVLTDWREEPISPLIPPGQERWVWIDTNESTLILNPLTTFLNTYYFALARAYDDDTRVNWVYCRDDANPDEEDEGDCYDYYSSFFYRRRDLFLNISILPESLEVFPTDINMQVNGIAVTNVLTPSKGWWDSGAFQPPLALNGAGRNFQVTVNWLEFYQWPVEFDVEWTGAFIESTSILAGFDFTSGHLEVNWAVTIIIDFPQNVKNQTVLIELDPEWIVRFITRNTLLYEDWTIMGTTVFIDHAEDGLWAIYCTVPMSPFTLYGGLILWVVVILVAVFLVLFVFYRQQFLLPKQRTRRRLLQTLADSFADIEKIKRILLIHKETGLCLLDPIMDRTMNANLVTALIQAITTFGISLTETENEDSYVPIEDHDTPLREIKYRDFHIVVHDGTYMRNAIIFKQPPSDQLHARLEQFTLAFEEEYADVLENWAGRLNIFGEAIDLVDKYFFISFRLPHAVRTEKSDEVSLTSAERRLFSLAKALNAEQDSFLIRDLLDRYTSDSDAESLEVFEAIFSLRQKQLIGPLQTHIPYTLVDHNHTGP
ncbi:MAG: hypothetical protein ACFE89_10625 [Candidatus Hodarchaeota archaeon]